jgi:hypothetical protein
VVFFKSPHRETPKNATKDIEEKIGFGFFSSIFFVLAFRHGFFVQHFSPDHGKKKDASDSQSQE